MMYDVAIIGAGPAGATLARLLDASHSVLLVDRRQFDADSDADMTMKCCGGLLAPDAQRMLSRFGLGLPKQVLVEPQLFVVRAIDLAARRERFYQRFYINMDRLAFDRWLVSMIPSGVDARFGWRFKSYRAEGDGFEIELDRDGETIVERARILVGADGASSRVRELARPGVLSNAGYFAVQEWIEAESALPYFSAIFDSEITDYYGWTIPKGEHLLVGAALRPKDNTSKKFDLLKERLGGWGFRLGKTVRREGTFLLRPRSFEPIAVAGRGIALVGEAGGWISPSSAEGFSYAFRGAMALAESLDAGLDGFERRYSRNMRTLRWNLVLKSAKARLLFNPRLRNLAMRSGACSMAAPRQT